MCDCCFCHRVSSVNPVCLASRSVNVGYRMAINANEYIKLTTDGLSTGEVKAVFTIEITY